MDVARRPSGRLILDKLEKPSGEILRKPLVDIARQPLGRFLLDKLENSSSKIHHKSPAPLGRFLLDKLENSSDGILRKALTAFTAWQIFNDPKVVGTELAIETYSKYGRPAPNGMRKITIHCGPPGSGKSVSQKSVIVDFDEVADYVYAKLDVDCPRYLLGDNSQFRSYVNNVEAAMLRYLCSGPFTPDVTVLSCTFEKPLTIIDSCIPRFGVIIGISYFELSKTPAPWIELQDVRKKKGKVNYRTSSLATYTAFAQRGRRVWQELQKLSRDRPEIWVDKVEWSEAHTPKGSLEPRPIFALTPCGEFAVKGQI